MSAAADAEDRREAIADADAVFGADLIGGDASRVGLERQDDQVEHGADVVGRPARRDVEVDRPTIDLRQGLAQPVLGPREPAFDLAERLRNSSSRCWSGRPRLLRSERESSSRKSTRRRPEASACSRAARSPFAGGSKRRSKMRRGVDSAGTGRPWASKEIVVDRLLVPTPPWLERTSEGMRVWAPAWRAISWSSEIEFCRLTRMSAPVSQTSTVLCPTSKRLVGCDRPPKMVMSRRCGASGSRGLVSAIVGAVGVGEPVPVLAESEEFCLGSATPLPKKKRTEALRPLGRRIGVRHGFQPGQGQRQSGAAEEGSPIEMPGGTGHGRITFRF